MSEYIIAHCVDSVSGVRYDERREEIVRCMDCKYGHEVYWPAYYGIPSDYLDCTGPLVTSWDEYHDVPKDNPVRPDGFCKWGERKENGR